VGIWEYDGKCILQGNGNIYGLSNAKQMSYWV
jgi:hypothetical protein